MQKFLPPHQTKLVKFIYCTEKWWDFWVDLKDQTENATSSWSLDGVVALKRRIELARGASDSVQILLLSCRRCLHESADKPPRVIAIGTAYPIVWNAFKLRAHGVNRKSHVSPRSVCQNLWLENPHFVNQKNTMRGFVGTFFAINLVQVCAKLYLTGNKWTIFVYFCISLRFFKISNVRIVLFLNVYSAEVVKTKIKYEFIK